MADVILHFADHKTEDQRMEGDVCVRLLRRCLPVPGNVFLG